MLRPPITLSAALLLLGCGAEKRGIAGASCSALLGCEAPLRCVSNVCVDTDRLQADDQRAHEEMTATLKQLKEEQAKLQRKQAELKAQIDKITDEAERASHLTQIQANDTDVAASAATQGTGVNDTATPALEIKNTSAPLAGQ